MRSDYHRALALCERAIWILERVANPNHTVLTEAMNTLGSTLRARGELDRARDVLNRGLAIATRTNAEHDRAAKLLYSLGLSRRALETTLKRSTTSRKPSGFLHGGLAPRGDIPRKAPPREGTMAQESLCCPRRPRAVRCQSEGSGHHGGWNSHRSRGRFARPRGERAPRTFGMRHGSRWAAQRGGVYGLRRAFALAGVRSQVTSYARSTTRRVAY
jgi:hypothetical protein